MVHFPQKKKLKEINSPHPIKSQAFIFIIIATNVFIVQL